MLKNQNGTLKIEYSVMKTKTIATLAMLILALLGEKSETYAGETAPVNMALIPAGSFQMGDTFNEGLLSERPAHTVYISSFYMDKYEVTKELWDQVYQWATNRGYIINSRPSGKEYNHPVHSANWYDAVKWCNARSEMEGRKPAYFKDPTKTIIYRDGDVDLPGSWVNWDEGYRLPTEAEREKAARG